MAVSAAAVTAKLVALTLSDRNGRTVVFSVIAALVTPVILIATMIMCTLSGTVDHNISAVQLSFHGGYLSSKVPAEYRMYIENMQDSFAKLDGVLNEINGMAEAEEAIEEERFEFLFVYSAVAILALHDEVGKSKTDNP